MKTPNYRPIKNDARYTVAKEFCGQKTARYVARFAGEWIGKAGTHSGAVMLATGHRQRNGALIAEEIKACSDVGSAVLWAVGILPCGGRFAGLRSQSQPTDP